MIVIQNLQLLYLLLIITTNIPFFGSSFVTTQHSTRRTCYNDNYYNIIVTRRIRKIKNGCYTLTNHCHCQNNKDNDNNIDSNNNNNNNANNDNDDDDDDKNNNNNNKMMINYNENEMNLVFQ